MLVLLSGCTPMEWRRAGTPEDVMAADRADCRKIAALQAWRLDWHRGLFAHRHVIQTADGRLVPAFDPFFDSDPFGDRFFLEGDLEDDCLRAQGYELVPLAPN
jgi:hypothetical protein